MRNIFIEVTGAGRGNITHMHGDMRDLVKLLIEECDKYPDLKKIICVTVKKMMLTDPLLKKFMDEK